MRRREGRRSRGVVAGLGAALLGGLLGAPASADVALPPGFTTHIHVTGQGFDPSTERSVRGLPATSTLGFDTAGTLYLGKVGARFRQGEAEDWSPIYRIPAVGATITPDAEGRYLYGPPLQNPQVGAVGPGGELFVTTYDRDRRLGALYRMTDGRPVLLAGGTPENGRPPLLRHPEGVALDAAGNVYVADREQGVIVRLDPRGRVLDAEHVRLTRPRVLTFDEAGQLWIGGDGTAQTPWQDGAGEIWKVGPDGRPTLVLEGPLPAGFALSPGGALFVAQRRRGRLFIVTPEGRSLEFATLANGTAVRGLRFAPVTPETRRAGIAGDLFVIVVRRYAWPVNEVIRISGPFDEFVRQGRSVPP